MTSNMPNLCDDSLMQEIVRQSDADNIKGVADIDKALGAYPDDPRLHFLKGSLLIGLKRHVEAHDALVRAVAIAPEFALARFQLGFFELTSGEANTALETWGPLRNLPEGHWIRGFVTGLEHLIADRFEACIASLKNGMAANDENPPLNKDMQLIITKCEELLADKPPTQLDDGEVSAASLLLRSSGASKQ
jgi:tetratricopeptide (TPR) repeat protein